MRQPQPAGSVSVPASDRAGRLAHGGDLEEAAAAGHAVWLDLSTGINPYAYPAAAGTNTMQALPQHADEARLEATARVAYRVPPAAGLVAAPGTQAIIQWLPYLVPARRVAVLGPTYAEHAAAWQRTAVVSSQEALDVQAAELWVVVNPNNPDGRRLPPGHLADFAAEVARGPGRRIAEAGHPVLIVDEAFMDTTPHDTVAGAPHTLVLRSFGKFYGLAGLRLGFAAGARATVDALAMALGPWAVSGPALKVGARGLGDLVWASEMRRRLAAERAALDGLLAGAGFAIVGGTDLFRLARRTDAAAWHQRLAAAGVWTRRFPDRPDLLRFGLPGSAAPRFAAILARLSDGS